MNRILFRASLLFATATSLLCCRLRGADFKLDHQTFTLPDGFVIELVADSSLVQRPISASFDEQGRLYVTDSSGSNDKPDKQLEEKPHRVVRLEDSDGDGRFDKSIVFADRMMFPEGCLWYEGSLYVAAPPSIWKLTDTNADGVVDVREEWHQGKTLTGCANDLHGPFLGLDGLIYWCKGAFQQQSYVLPNGKPFVSRAAHIFRARPDHSMFEPVLTGGMDNPVGVAFTPEGERILCGTFFAPHEPGHRDGLIHAVYGGVYGKINDVNDSHKKTGELMPVMTHMGPAAPCSVIRYESGLFGDDYRNNLFVCAFNLRKISRHVMQPEGATFKTKDTDFLTSDNPDFHPTDVIEDADGSLIVLDTGGWYKICCPTSQLSKPDVLGTVYRIRKTGSKTIADPRGLKIAWSKMTPPTLAPLLADERIFVQRRAIAELGKKGEAAVPVLSKTISSGPTVARQNAIWALTRIDSPASLAAVREGLKDPEPQIRAAALNSASARRDGHAADKFEPKTRLEARLYLELLGRTGQCDERVDKLASSLAHEGAFRPGKDRFLQHGLTYALIESGAEKTARRLLDQKPAGWPAALIALDQMDNSHLEAARVAPLLASSDPDVRTAAFWVAGHHPDWGDALADFFKARLGKTDLSPSETEPMVSQLARFSHSAAIQKLLSENLADDHANPAVRQLALKVMAASGLKDIPSSWIAAVRSSLSCRDEALLHPAISAAHALGQGKTNSPNFSEPLLQIARDASQPASLRLEALAALPSGVRSMDPHLFQFLCEAVTSSGPLTERTSAANTLARSKLSEDQFLALADTLKTTGPLETTRLIEAFTHTTSEPVGLKLIAALKDAKSVTSIRPDLLQTVVAKYPPAVQEQSQALLAVLSVDAPKQAAHLEELLKENKTGDIRRGQTIFNSPKAACATCHTMGYLGGKIGPDLTSISQARTERDLLESILYPSASFVRSYEPYLVTTKTDESFTGVLKKDAPDEVVLAMATGEVHLPRSDITDMRPGTVSIMPAGLEQQLTRQELADLLAFLKSTKWGPR